MTSLRAEINGRIAVVTLDRPERRNALTRALIEALWSTFSDLATDDAVDVVVLTGADPAFCAGVDLAELEETGAAPPQPSPLPPLAKPLVGAVNGPAVTGGLELALMCDVLVASDRARFGDTHARFGMLPAWGQTARLPRAIGVSRALELLLTSRLIDADEALRIGLVTSVVPHDELLERALGLARAIAEAHQPAARATLDLVRRSAGLSLSDALALERATAHEWQGAGLDTATLAARRDATLAANRDSRPG